MPFIEENEKIKIFSEKAVEVHLIKGSNTDVNFLILFKLILNTVNEIDK